MNNKGFSLVELLASLVIIAILFGIAMYLFRGTYSSTMTQFDYISDTEAFNSARSYALETNAFGSNDYACVTIRNLIDYGYLSNKNYEDKTIKLTRDNVTKVIEEIKYVDEC